MQAIEVKYLPATNTKPSRYKATAEAGSITVPYDYDVCDWSNQENAARALLNKLGWDNDIAGGVIPNGNAVFVLLDRSI